jgi:RHS repeat-associated protein
LVDTNNLTGYAQVVEELQNGSVTKQYTYGLDLISQRQSSGVSFYNYDGHGSVRGLSNNLGNVTDTYSYDAFGTLIERTGTTDNNYLYAGEQFDSDLGFYYNRARYLNVNTGRFISQDTFEGRNNSPKSLHKYTYGENDSINNLDPSGNAVGLGVADVAYTQQIAAILNTVALLAVHEIIKTITTTITEEIDKPLILYHYTLTENVAGILATGIRPSIRDENDENSDAQHGDGQYFTDITNLEAEQHTMYQLSRALFINPFHWGGKRRSISYIAIKTNGLRIKRAVPVFSKTYGNKYIYVKLGVTPLLMDGVLFDTGEVNFSEVN